jgi:hypothetical protein
LYSGEAILALAEAYTRVREARYLSSGALGLGYYDVDYFRRSRVADGFLVFFAN